MVQNHTILGENSIVHTFTLIYRVIDIKFYKKTYKFGLISDKKVNLLIPIVYFCTQQIIQV